MGDLRDELRALADAEKAAFFPRFFKTGKGQYGEGDVFIGVTVPQIRKAIKSHRDLPLSAIKRLLDDPVHEFRLAALLMLGEQYKRGDQDARERIVAFYQKNIDRVNNWDLVDSSAPHILGKALLKDKATLLDELAASGKLWRERIAVVATQEFIRHGRYDDTLKLAERFLTHEHDLMHKAVGWMLREVGKRDETVLKRFLNEHAGVMPRTMLRYAIERLPETERRRYMAGTPGRKTKKM